MTGEPFIYRQQNFRKQSNAVKNHSFTVSNAAATRILAMTNGNDAGIFNCVLTAIGIVLSRYTGQAGIVIETALLDEVSGKTLPVSFNARSGSTLREYLNDVQETIGNAYLQEDLLAVQPASQSNMFILS